MPKLTTIQAEKLREVKRYLEDWHSQISGAVSAVSKLGWESTFPPMNILGLDMTQAGDESIQYGRKVLEKYASILPKELPEWEECTAATAWAESELAIIAPRMKNDEVREALTEVAACHELLRDAVAASRLVQARAVRDLKFGEAMLAAHPNDHHSVFSLFYDALEFAEGELGKFDMARFIGGDIERPINRIASVLSSSEG